MEHIKDIVFIFDDIREHIEDYIVSNVLQRWDEFNKTDDLRLVANMAIINFVISYAETQGIPASQIPQATKEKIAKAGAKVEKKLNALLQKQLSKKSKMYRKRHNV